MEFLKRLFRREEKQPERMLPKPHIKKHAKGYYMCEMLVEGQPLSYYVCDIGSTPHQAYENWYKLYNGEF